MLSAIGEKKKGEERIYSGRDCLSSAQSPRGPDTGAGVPPTEDECEHDYEDEGDEVWCLERSGC